MSANPIPLGRSSLAGTTFESSIFVSGGASANKVPEKNVYATSVVGGIVRTWTVAPDLPKPVYGHAMVTNGMRVFVIGGQDGFALRNDVLAASINPGGELGPWAAVDSLPYVVTSHGAASVGSRIFVIGGVNTNNFSIADVYAGVVVESRIDWSPVTPLPLARANACVTTDGSTIYVLGGFVTSTTVGDSVMIGSVSPSGALTWTTSAPMPVVKVAFGCAVAP